VPRLRFNSAGVRVDLECADAVVADLVADVGAEMLARGDAAADAVVSFDPAPDEAIDRAAARCLSLVDRAALGNTDCLTVHAAALAGARGCVVVPGASGVGKTTLAAACMQTGLTLLSDEAACFSQPTGALVPHPRPLGLSQDSRQLLGLASPSDTGDEEATAPALLGQSAPHSFRGECVLVAVPLRRKGAEAALEPLTPAEGLAALLASCLNVPPLDGQSGWQPADAWRYLSALSANVRLARLTFDDPYAAARLLVGALGA
jgi:hypothetical protein